MHMTSQNKKKPRRRTRLKVILLGESGVGKTFLYKRFTTNKIPTTCVATLGMDFSTKEFTLDDQFDFNLDIWDTAGQEKFRAVNRTYYNESDLAFFVYDITDRNSFNNLQFWIDDYFNSTSSDNPIILLGRLLDSFQKADYF